MAKYYRFCHLVDPPDLGTLNLTVIAVWPRPISSTHSLSRKIRSAWATASYRLPAVTSIACSTPRRSMQETLHVFRGTLDDYRIRFLFARIRHHENEMMVPNYSKDSVPEFDKDGRFFASPP